MYKDATLCSGEKCPFKDTCNRHIWYKEGQQLDEIMSVFMTPPLEKEKNNKPTCEHYWGNNQQQIPF